MVSPCPPQLQFTPQQRSPSSHLLCPAQVMAWTCMTVCSLQSSYCRCVLIRSHLHGVIVCVGQYWINGGVLLEVVQVRNSLECV